MTTPAPERHPPGSAAAREHGCTCPVLDNAHGRGVWPGRKGDEPLYWYASDCPYHFQQEATLDGQGQ